MGAHQFIGVPFFRHSWQRIKVMQYQTPISGWRSAPLRSASPDIFRSLFTCQLALNLQYVRDIISLLCLPLGQLHVPDDIPEPLNPSVPS